MTDSSTQKDQMKAVVEMQQKLASLTLGSGTVSSASSSLPADTTEKRTTEASNIVPAKNPAPSVESKSPPPHVPVAAAASAPVAANPKEAPPNQSSAPKFSFRPTSAPAKKTIVPLAPAKQQSSSPSHVPVASTLAPTVTNPSSSAIASSSRQTQPDAPKEEAPAQPSKQDAMQEQKPDNNKPQQEFENTQQQQQKQRHVTTAEEEAIAAEAKNRPPTPNPGRPQTPLTRSLMNANYVEERLRMKRAASRARTEQEEEGMSMPKQESIFSMASKAALKQSHQQQQQQFEASDTNKARHSPDLHQAPSSSANPSTPPKKAPAAPQAPQKQQPQQQSAEDKHRLAQREKEAAEALTQEIKNALAKRQWEQEQKQQQSRNKHSTSSSSHHSAAAKKQTRAAAIAQEEDIEEIDTETLARVIQPGDAGVFADLVATANHLFRRPNHPSMDFEVDDSELEEYEDDDGDRSSFDEGSDDFSSDGEEEYGEYDDDDDDGGEEEESEYDEEPLEDAEETTEDDPEGVEITDEDDMGAENAFYLPNARDVKNLNALPPALVQLFEQCTVQTELAENIGKMRRFMRRNRADFTEQEHDKIKELCITSNDIAQEMVQEYDAKLEYYKEQCKVRNTVIKMIDVRSKFYSMFKEVLAEYTELSETFQECNETLAEAFHYEVLTRNQVEERATSSGHRHKQKKRHRRQHEQDGIDDDDQQQPQQARQSPSSTGSANTPSTNAHQPSPHTSNGRSKQPSSSKHLPTEEEYFRMKRDEPSFVGGSTTNSKSRHQQQHKKSASSLHNRHQQKGGTKPSSSHRNR